jgi:hypothetical protein
MNRPQGRPIDAAHMEEDKGLAERRDAFHREEEFRRAQRQEGENFNLSFRGGGGNPRFYGNQQGRDVGQGGFNGNPSYGDQFRGGAQGNRAGNFGGGYKRGQEDREGDMEPRDFDLRSKLKRD